MSKRVLKPDRRKLFIYRKVLVTPQPVQGLLARTWKICDMGGCLLVDTKARAMRVIDALVEPMNKREISVRIVKSP